MASAAKKMWPGNNIPTFRNDEAMLKKLDELVKRLLPECEMPFFGEQAIRSHILDSLTERRRQVKKGHDYENVSSFIHVCTYDHISFIANNYMYSPYHQRKSKKKFVFKKVSTCM